MRPGSTLVEVQEDPVKREECGESKESSDPCERNAGSADEVRPIGSLLVVAGWLMHSIWGLVALGSAGF
jgi:hypothetical protein